ncbi:hypothetical protein JCM24511_05220 [Saitozyma sp. JCM 24511]|nr:hypothetical protein JCM24511_05220 [Saitozyma sp. JCM 24511]
MPPSRKFSSPLSSATPSPNLPPRLEAEETKPDPELDLDLDLNGPSSAMTVGVEATDDARSRLSSELSEELDDDEELGDRDGEGEGNAEGQEEDEDEDGDDGEGDDGRDVRSLTSDTVPRSPRTESDLTEEPDLPDEELDEEAEGDDEGEEIKLENFDEEPQQGAKTEPEPETIEVEPEDEPNDADADAEAEADVDEDEDKTNVLPRSKRVKRIESVSMSGSPSLTPPPPSVKGKPRGLPKLSISPRVTRANGSQSQDMADVGAEGDDNGDSVDGLDGGLAEDEAQDEEQDDEDDREGDGDGDENDEEGEGDVTMRPGDDLGVDMEVDEADVVAPEDAPADVDADAEVDVEAEAEAEAEEAEAEAPEPAEGEDGEQQEDEAAEEEGDVDAVETASQLTLPLRLGTHSHTSHAPPPTAAALRSLLMLEIKFAALRDRLYIERMEEAAAEEEMIHDGTHPALTYLYKTLAGRREKLHEVASRRHQQTLEELVKAREAEKDAVWTWWTDERDQLHWEEFEQTWSKRRRLAREKNEIETPRPAKPIPRPTDRLAGKGFNWAQGAVPSRLSMDDAAADLALMENRRPVQYSRHASPAVFTQQSHSGYPASAAAGPSTQTSYAAYPANQSYSKAGGTSTADHSRHTHPEAHPHAHAHAHSTAPARPPQQPSQQQQQQQQPARPQQSTAQMFNQLASGGQVEHSGSAPSTSGSGGTASQVGQQAQVPRREGRTVPTTSTMFGGLVAKEPVKVESASAGGTNGLPSSSGSGWGTGLGLGLGGMGGMGGNKLVNGHNKEAVPGSGPAPAGASVPSSGPGPGARMGAGAGAGAGAHSGLGGQSNGPNQPSSAAGAAQSTAPTTGDKRPTPPSAAAPERRYGLADYLGGSPSGAFGSFSAGLGKVGVLSPPNVGLGDHDGAAFMSRAGTITARGFTRRNETGGLEWDGTRKRERGLATFEKAQRSSSYKNTIVGLPASLSHENTTPNMPIVDTCASFSTSAIAPRASALSLASTRSSTTPLHAGPVPLANGRTAAAM